MMRVALAASLLLSASCESEGKGAYARRIAATTELIGGPGALGDVGDWLIGNQRIRIIIQDQGWSRGFGIFGGGIIDADLVRASGGSLEGGNGRDNFGEFFPALFLQAFDVADQWVNDPETGDRVQVPGIEIIADGSDGGPAILRTRASGGDFLTLVQDLLGAAVPKVGLRFETDYIVRPGARHVEVVGRLINISGRTIPLPSEGVSDLLGQFGIDGLQVPLGDVALFGAGNEVFAPGAVSRWDNGAALEGVAPKNIGFDLRFSVEANYEIPRTLPALPGLTVDFLATAGPEVSYGFAVADNDRNFVWLNREAYEKDENLRATKHSMLVPFLIDAFAGAYFVVPPTELAPAGRDGDIFEYSRYVIIGTGDVASIRDELYRIRGIGTARVRGRIVNQQTGEPETEAWLHILDEDGRPYSQVQVNEDGRFICNLEPGTYYTIVTAPGRFPYPGRAKDERTRFSTYSCAENRSASYSECAEPRLRDRELYIELPPPAELVVDVRDAAGRPLPAKVSVVSTYEADQDGKAPMEFLFDHWLGEARRSTDLTWKDPPAGRQRRFVEKVLLTHDGFLRADVRPSCNGGRCRLYDIYVSRGPEYDLHLTRNVRLEAGRQKQINAELTRVVDTTDWVSADMHVHSINSVDSFFAVNDRLKQAAAEGLEIVVATDHNWVSDWRPEIAALGLGDWLHSFVGVELSTLEAGHFNVFPLRYDLGTAQHFPFVEYCNAGNQEKVNGTAFDWVECSPGQLFANARQLGRFGTENTIVQVNHPRDTILGYFNQYFVNPYTGRPDCRGDTGDDDDPACGYCGDDCGSLFASNYPQAGLSVQPQNRVPGQFGRTAFSFAFDAIEVFNGKRLDLLHGFRVAEEIPPERLSRITDICDGGHPDNAPGELRLRSGGHIAYPGGVDDWLAMLNDGHRATAVGNSDSHKLAAEVGSPRTYLYVEPDPGDGSPRDDAPRQLSGRDLVEAIQGHRAIATNGPFLDMAVITARANDPDAKRAWPIGSLVEYAGDNRGREVEFLFVLRSAPWVSVEEIWIWVNGRVVERLPVPQEPRSDGRAVDDDNTFRWTSVFDQDVVVVAEARGSKSLFPVVTPREVPPTNISDALGGITSGLGLEDTFGRGDNIVAPDFVQKATPYALTNPIWLDIDGSGEWQPPGNGFGPGPAPKPAAGQCPEQSEMRARQDRVDGRLFSFPRQGRHYERADIRKLFHVHATE